MRQAPVGAVESSMPLAWGRRLCPVSAGRGWRCSPLAGRLRVQQQDGTLRTDWWCNEKVETARGCRANCVTTLHQVPVGVMSY